jgi:toxin CcdB
MPQFHVHRNPNPATRERFPYLLDVQSDLVAGLATRVVTPLCPPSPAGPIKTLTPVFEIESRPYVMLTPQLAGVPARQLGAEVADLSGHRAEILAALDLLFTGV